MIPTEEFAIKDEEFIFLIQADGRVIWRGKPLDEVFEPKLADFLKDLLFVTSGRTIR